MNAELSAICDRILSAVLNGVGQGLVLVLLVIVLLKLFRGTNAATRHAIQLATIILLAVLPIAHFCSEDSEWSWFSTRPDGGLPATLQFESPLPVTVPLEREVYVSDENAAPPGFEHAIPP